MFTITKVFNFPMGHRLSNLTKSKCVFVHGHNFKLEITVKSSILNKNDMVMDFSNLKKLVNSIIDTWDHGMFLNKNDDRLMSSECATIHYIDGDPTAEKLCLFLYNNIEGILPKNVSIHSVIIWETDDSKATYSE